MRRLFRRIRRSLFFMLADDGLFIELARDWVVEVKQYPNARPVFLFRLDLASLIRQHLFFGDTQIPPVATFHVTFVSIRRVSVSAWSVSGL